MQKPPPRPTRRRSPGTLRRVLVFCLLAVIVLAVYAWLTGQIGLGEASSSPGQSGLGESVQHTIHEASNSLFRDKDLHFINVLIGGFAMIGAIFTLYMNQTQLEATLDEFRESNQLTHYAELDRLYFDLLRLAVQHPHLRNPDSIDDPVQKRQYDAYAYMVWNFIETVIDRVEMEKALATKRTDIAPSPPKAAPVATVAAGSDAPVGLPAPVPEDNDLPDYEDCGLNLKQTWQAAVRVEAGIHGDWLTEHNARRFKEGFHALVKQYC